MLVRINNTACSYKQETHSTQCNIISHEHSRLLLDCANWCLALVLDGVKQCIYMRTNISINHYTFYFRYVDTISAQDARCLGVWNGIHATKYNRKSVRMSPC